MSYRNPDASMGELTMDDYLVDGVLSALDQVQRLTGAPRVNIAGLCLGGTYAVLAAAHLAARRQADRLGWVTITNTLIDFSEPGDLGVFTDAGSVQRLEKAMARKGFLDASQMATTFDMLRGNDLVWNYVVSNWFMGRKPPSFDILAWNADSTNMPARMHSQYLHACYVENRLVRPGAFSIAGTPVDLSRVRTPFFVLSAEADHITPWKGTYKTTQVLGGEVTYVLTNSGHIAGVVNPPGAPQSAHWTNPKYSPDPVTWRQGAVHHQGSWWETWISWAAERSGPMVAPPVLPPGEPAPGRHVRNQTGPEFAASVEATAAAPRRRAAASRRGAPSTPTAARRSARRRATGTAGPEPATKPTTKAEPTAKAERSTPAAEPTTKAERSTPAAEKPAAQQDGALVALGEADAPRTEPSKN
jgi:polyhydroxyalkanoate synthase